MNKILFLIINFLTTVAFAAPDSFVYEGILLDSSNIPITTSTLLTLSIYDPAITCLLYQEQQTVTPTSNGSFSVLVGSALAAPKRSVNDAGLTMVDIFTNTGTVRPVSSPNCPPGYNPATSDTRKLSITVNATTLSPAIDLTGAPFAMTAAKADKLGAYPPTKLLRNDGASAVPALDDVKVSLLMSILSGSLGTPTAAGDAANKSYVDSQSSGKLNSSASFGGDVTGVYSATVVSKIQGTTVSASAPTNGQVLQFNGTAWAPATSSAANTFATGTAGTDFNIASSGGAYTLNLPTASASSRGALSSTDWSTFNGKLSSALTSALVWVGSSGGIATAVPLSGDATISNAGVVTVDKSTLGANNKILQLDGTGVATTKGLNLATGTGSVLLKTIAGTTTNYALTLPPSAPATDGQFLTSLTSGIMSWASTTSFATTTTAAMIVYVRADGSDSTCDGSVNASTTSAPNCAFLTLQGALDKTPDILKHTITIRVATTLTATVANRPLAVVNKLITAIDEITGPLLVIEGNAGVQTLSNSLANVGAILIPKASRGVYLKNLTFNGFTGTAVDVDGGVAILESVAFNNNYRSLSVSRGGMGQFLGTGSSITLSNAGPKSSTGIEVGGGRVSSGTLTINTGNFPNNRAIEVSEGEYSLDTGGILSISESGSSTNLSLIEVGPLGRVGSEVGSSITLNLSSSNAQSSAINNRGGTLQFSGVTILNGVAGNGLVCDAGARCEFDGAFRILSSFGSARFVTVRRNSSLLSTDDFQILASVSSGNAGVDVFGNSSFVYSPMSAGKSLTFSAGFAGSSAIRLNGTSIFSSTSGTAFTTTFGTGFSNVFSLSANSSADVQTSGTVSYAGGEIMLDANSTFTTNSPTYPISRRACAAGLISYGRGANAFCMEATDNSPTIFYSASSLCSNKAMKLCSISQFGNRCSSANYTTGPSWAQEATSVSCSASTFLTDNYSGTTGITTSLAYRCCL